MVSKGFPNVTTSGRQYNIGEKPSVILYTYINLHGGTPKPQSLLSKSSGLQCSNNMVLQGVRTGGASCGKCSGCDCDVGIESVNVKNRYQGARVSARRANREPEDGIRWKFVHGRVVVVI